MRKWKIGALILGLLFLWGCRKEPRQEPLTPVVRQIRLETDNLSYEASQDLETSKILTYLRLAVPESLSPVNPELVKGPMYTITVLRSDGTGITYRQKSDKYFCVPDGTWHKIDPATGAYLEVLLRSFTERR